MAFLCCNPKCAVISLCIVGFVGLLVGGLVYGVFPSIFSKKVQESLVLKEGSDALKRFESPPVETLFKVTLFNVINANEVNKIKGTIPQLEERGPYVFRMKKTKLITGWSSSKDYVYYKDKTEYIFDETLSKGMLSDTIYHINAPDIGIAKFLIANNKMDLAIFLTAGLAIKHTVSELLFEGYKVPLLAMAESLNISIPEILPNNRFGLFYLKNNTFGPEYTVNTGYLNMENFGHIYMFDGNRKLPFWQENTHCTEINGTDGSQYPPGVKETDSLYVFTSDLCRSLVFKYTESVTVEGIAALRFEIPASVFADPNTSDENGCYCLPNIECPKAGVIPLEHSCRLNQPIAMSAPHFYLGDKQYVDAFVGLKSDKALHGTYIDVEPLTGTVIRGRKRLQVNIAVFEPEEGKSIYFLRNAKKGFFPIAWIEEGADIDKETAEEFKNQVINPKKTAESALIAVIAIGGVAILMAIALHTYKRK